MAEGMQIYSLVIDTISKNLQVSIPLQIQINNASVRTISFLPKFHF